jgi:two-component system LytT family response regulator
MSEHIKALIVDDEQSARESLKRALMTLNLSVDLVGMAENAQQAIDIIIDRRTELVFLDIEMPGHDGFWLANQIQKLNIPIHLIFVTAYNEYAIQAFRYAAFDFLTKPLDIDQLQQTMDRYLKEYKHKNFNAKMNKLQAFLSEAKLKLNTQNGFQILLHNSIVYCEAKGNFTIIHLVDGQKEMVCNQLGMLEEKLQGSDFIRVHRSVLINVTYLKSFNRKTKIVVLTDSLQKYEVKVSSSGIKKLSSLPL